MRKLFFLLFLYSFSALSAGGKGADACKKAAGASQKDYKCGQCEPELIDKFDKMLDGLKEEEKKFDNIESVMALLPESMRKDVAFMGQSRSLQQGDRYLMKSPGSEIVASFNGHPERRGGNNIEIMKFNGKTGTFDFIDIELKNGVAKVTENPRKCAACHGSGIRARPIFDPYRFWFNMVPSTGDTVPRGTSEEKDFLDYLRKIENKEDKPEWRRFSHLKGVLEQNPIADVEAGLKKKGYWHVKAQPVIPGTTSSPDDGPGVRLFDEMYLNNHCRINNLLSSDPNFETTKYLLAAATERCIDPKKGLSEFIPESILEKNKNYFITKGTIPEGTKGSGFKEVAADTEKRQERYFKDRVGRKLWMLEERFRNEGLSEEEAYKKAKEDIQNTTKRASKNFGGGINKIEDREESIGVIGPLRYAMEPLGFNTGDLSISFDPGSFTFGDFIQNMGNFDPLKSIANKFSCDELKQKSMEAFQDKEKQIVDIVQNNCATFDPVDKDLGFLSELADKANEKALVQKRAKLRSDMADILDMNSCTRCHRPNSSKGAPDLPFDGDKMDEFDSLMNKTAGELGDMRKRIWSRINRPSSQHGAMPPRGLDADEKKLVKEYLETFVGNDKAEKDKLRLDDRRSVILEP